MRLSRYRVLFLAVSILAVLYSCSSPTNPTTTGTIQVSSTPTGASVFLDGADKSKVTNCSLTNVPAGSHTIKLVKSGYVDYQGTASVIAGQMTTFSAILTPVAGAGALAVTPATGFTPNGNTGGPFAPSSQAYTLQNTGTAPIDWTASATQAWVTVSPVAGSLAAGAMVTVTVSVNAGANGLAAGVYNDTVTFTNTTNAVGNTTRPVSLSVTSGVTFISVTIDYTRVLPIPNPNGLDFPWVSWTYAGGNGTRGMAKVVDDVFTSPNIAIPTETVITIWVTDLKMDNGVTTRVCRTIKVNGQLIDVGTTIYGETTFIIGSNGIIRRP